MFFLSSGFIEYEVQADQNILQLSTQNVKLLQEVIQLESVLVLCYAAFKERTSFYCRFVNLE
jgi:hypothetical protein